MTLSDTPNKEFKYGNDVTDIFSFTFTLNKAADLNVTLTDANGVETPLLEGTGVNDYAINVVPYPGNGTIKYPAGLGAKLATGQQLTLARAVGVTQDTVLTNQSDYNASSVESTFDYSRMIDQQQQEQIDRSIKAPISDDSGANYQLPTPKANAVIGVWGAGATAIVEGPLVTEISAASTNAIAAAASAGAAFVSETNAAASDVSAGLSAAAAAAAAGSNLLSKISQKDADYTIAANSDDGTMFTIGNSAAVALTLPDITIALEGERYGFLRTGAAFPVTLIPNGTDRINGVGGIYTVEPLDGTVLIVLADENAVDNWIVIPWTQATAGAGLSKTGSVISLNLASDQSWTGSQRVTPVTDNDGIFDMNAGQDFKWTPIAADTLDFTNVTVGQRGMIKLINPTAFTITKGVNVEVDFDFLSTVSKPGTYILSYWSIDGVIVTVMNSQAVSV